MRTSMAEHRQRDRTASGRRLHVAGGTVPGLRQRSGNPWIINVAMVEAVASLGFMFLGPLGTAPRPPNCGQKLAIRAAIKGVIKKVASEGATTSLKAAAKKAPTVMAKEISHQAVTEAAVDQAGRRIAAADGSTSTSFSESGGALRDGAVYGAGSSLARRGMG